jgi:membrane associated rhomboid family serine protease
MRVRYSTYQSFSLNAIWVIIIVNLLFFIVTAIVSGLRPFLWLHPVVFLAQPWTILTSMFVHAGLWHILANMFTLYFFGSAVYRLVGTGRFLAVYFGGGILGGIFYVFMSMFGSILSISFLGDPFIPAVGASGAVFALGGVLTMMRPKLRVFIFPIPAPIPLWIAVIGGFLILSFMPLIAWQAHLGGLALGLVAGYFFRKRERYSFY